MQSLKLLGFKYVARGKKSTANSCFDIVCDLVELPFRITTLQSRKLKAYEIPTISKRPNVAKNLMTNVRVKFQRSAYEMAYYRNEVTPNRRKSLTA
jgi:hypothetical protein